MTSEAQLRDELAEARSAKRLKDDILGTFFAEKDALLYEALKQTRLGDTETLNNIHHQMKSMNALQMELETVINTGKLAQAEVDALDKVNN